jgi:hypothetical protein
MTQIKTNANALLFMVVDVLLVLVLVYVLECWSVAIINHVHSTVFFLLLVYQWIHLKLPFLTVIFNMMNMKENARDNT